MGDKILTLTLLKRLRNALKNKEKNKKQLLAELKKLRNNKRLIKVYKHHHYM